MDFESLFAVTKELRVLFVEDEPEIRKSTASLLGNYFTDLVVCDNGEDGLKECMNGLKKNRAYDIVITDINMPYLNGVEMVSAIKEVNDDQAVIFLSAHQDKDCLLEAIKLGVNYYILKPVLLPELEKNLFKISQNIVNQEKVNRLNKIEEVQNKQVQRYKKALMEWSNIDLEDTETSILKATEISAKTLGIGRVSIWLYNEDASAIECKDLYILKEDEHVSGLSLEKSMFPAYFKALQKSRTMVVDNAREDARTCEFTQSYLEPLGIHSMLDIPIIQDGVLLGVVCHEALDEVHQWSLQEQEFAITLANNLALSFEIKKRREVQIQLKNQTDLLDYKAHHDALTGLPNRTLFMDRLDQSMKKSRRNNKKIALLFIDLDKFKEINDSFGHEAGDMVLKVLAQRFQEQIREGDTLARIGGDEFTLIIDDVKEIKLVIDIVQKLLQCARDGISIEAKELLVTLSIGISIYPNDGNTVDVLMRNADAAMYKAKQEGRNTYQYYTQEMTEHAVQRIVLEAKLREAIEEDNLMVYYQPQYNGLNDTLVGMEALIRWKGENGQMVYPDVFIPLAEETGLIIPLDRWVMQKTIEQFSLWYEAGLKPGKLSLNLAMKQLAQDDFIPFVSTLLSKHSDSIDWLQFEITEGGIMEDPEASIMKLEEIKKMGIKLAVDDFGTGYSSLSYLKKLPIDTLKIDRAFIKDLPDDEEDKAISKAIIALAKSLHLNVIAEGVETLEQKQFLLEHGCNWIQGYYYSPAISVQEMSKSLKEG